MKADNTVPRVGEDGSRGKAVVRRNTDGRQIAISAQDDAAELAVCPPCGPVRAGSRATVAGNTPCSWSQASRPARLVDGNEPPLPPKITFEHTRHMVEALARGTPDAGKIAKQLARDTIRQLT